MKLSSFNRYALTSCVILVLLAGCGGSQPPIGAPGAMAHGRAIARTRVVPHRVRTASSSYQVLYSFTANPDGAGPLANLTEVKGLLYGTTKHGGAYGRGTVFSITTSGAEKVLLSFHRRRDGLTPEAGLIDVSGTLYSTTTSGGKHQDGTVFRVTTLGKEHILHKFGGDPDGQRPVASLIDVKGVLYGTTPGGGTSGGCGDNGCGTVFSITSGNTEHVLHSFGAASGHDGLVPVAGLINLKGLLYGTTRGGGTICDSIPPGGCGGTAFSISSSGTEHVLYSFGRDGDGKYPYSSLIAVNGTLYGTTEEGGAYNLEGTVFSMSPSGRERVLHSFGSGSDGKSPLASLIDVKGTLYGTTYKGGSYDEGTIFSVSTSGTEAVLHSFGGGADGSQPKASLINVNGTLYGTTENGGKYGYGTVFSLTP